MPAGGTGNIFYEMLVNRQPSVFEQACVVDFIDHDGVLYPYTKVRVPYVETIETALGVSLRLVQWQHSLDMLQAAVEQAQPKNIFVGTFLSEQLDIVKRHHPRACTVSITYGQDQLPFLLRKWAHWQTGLVYSNEKHRQHRQGTASEFKQNLIKQGLGASKTFGYSIPVSQNTTADLQCNLEDLYHYPTMKTFLNSLGCVPGPEDWQYYHWYCAHSG